MLKKYSLLIVFVVLVLASSTAVGQTPPGGHVPPPNNPIDGGLGVLLALGIGYAINKLRKKN